MVRHKPFNWNSSDRDDFCEEILKQAVLVEPGIDCDWASEKIDLLFSRLKGDKMPANLHFAQEESKLTRKRKRGDDGGGLRKKQKTPISREVWLNGRPMSPPPGLASEPNWNSAATDGAPTTMYQAYSGSLSIRYATTVAPPPSTRVDHPTVSYNPVITVPPPIDNKKTVARQVLDPDRLKQWQATERRGFTTQSAVMGNYSAATVAANAGVIPWEQAVIPETNYGTSAWEWLHLVSFKMGGLNNDPQSPNNLVAGTYSCNSQMMSIEEAIKDLVLIHKRTLAVEVTAHCFNNTHLATKIEYNVFHRKNDKSTEVKFSQEFDALSHNNPFSKDKAIFLKALATAFDIKL